MSIGTKLQTKTMIVSRTISFNGFGDLSKYFISTALKMKYITLIMKAKKKQMDEKTPADYGVDVTPRLTVVSTVEPAARAAGVKVADVAELIAKLKDEAGVI